jgi:UDP-N-acetylmuramoylalanine--D-glutamate ligase
VDEIRLPGRAGLADTVAAAAGALAFGVDPKAVASAARAFRPLAHRLQTVAESDGVTYIDDSKATNPHATVAAVQGLRDVVLIAGGRAKDVDLGALTRVVPPVRAVVALGEAAPQLVSVLGDLVPVEEVASMRAAVTRARAWSTPGGSVLLSPACASFDMYSDYAARGEDFTRCVHLELGYEGAVQN